MFHARVQDHIDHIFTRHSFLAAAKAKASKSEGGHQIDHINILIKRIVKMTFREESVQTFITEVFEQSKLRIRAFEGCQHMELLRHKSKPNLLFTLSIWDDEAALEAYRASALFADTWAKTKALFAEKAEAWTVEIID